MVKPLPESEAENYAHAVFIEPVPIPSAPFDQGDRWALCVNGEWLARVLGALETLLNLDTWQGGRLQQEAAVEEARRMLASLYECEGTPVSFDCCDPILEKLDQIIALISRPPAADPAAVEDKRDVVQDILDTVPFDPLDLHPEAPTVSYTEGEDGGGAEILANRQQALCHGLWLAVAAVANKFNQDLLSTTIGVGVGIAWNSPWLFIFGVLPVVGVVGTLANAVFTDQTAIRNLVCCIRDELVAASLTRANLILAIQTCEVGANETLIGGALEVFFGDEVNWGLFIHDLGKSYLQIRDGVDLYCPCDDSEGVACDPLSAASNFEYDWDGDGSAWIPDGTAGTCPGFGHILTGGGDFNQGVDRCLHQVQLNRFFGGTTSNEALVARFTINGRVDYVPIVGGAHCTLEYDPPQRINSTSSLRIDLIGGGQKMCYTGLIAVMSPEDTA